MYKHILQPVILCGGSGTRLWPASRMGFPKQFLHLGQQQSLFQQALKRLAPSDAIAAPIIVGSQEHRFLMQDQLRNSGIENYQLILEPMQRNTAPAMTLAALASIEDESDPILVVMPADQTISDVDAFNTSITEACMLAQKPNTIILLGIKPTRPDTGYGYIKVRVNKHAGSIEQFTEKPDNATAQHYLESGQYWWNSGIFITHASSWLRAINHFRPLMAQQVVQSWEQRTNHQKISEPDATSFADITGDSVDYAVLEHCPHSPFALHMVALNVGWDDLGSWDAVWRKAPKTPEGNVLQGDIVVRDAENCYIQAESRMVAVLGIEDAVVIETPDAVLVTRRDHSQKVGSLIPKDSADKREEHAQHRKVQRPWGWYDLVDQGPGFKVKRIMVNPGASLSLQKHQHRAEHWVVVSGTARVECNDAVLELLANQSTYIPQGAIHRLSNPTQEPLEIIEVQSGSYLGEDDIIRLEDSYERVKKS